MADAPGPSTGPHGQPATRRRPGNITINACTECRKKRSKCDGKHPCTRCTSQHANCVYEEPQRQTKDEMRAEIAELRQHRQQAEEVFAALTADNSDEVLRRLRSKEPLSDIFSWLESIKSGTASGYATTFSSDATRDAILNALGRTHSAAINSPQQTVDGDNEIEVSISRRLQNETLMSHNASPASQNQVNSTTGSTPQVDIEMPDRPLIGSWSREPSSNAVQNARDAGQSAILGSPYAKIEGTLDEDEIPITWTRVTDDVGTVGHFMSLYFCWEYPTFASLAKDHFLGDFSTRRKRYCSELLVNAMLALGCRFSTMAQARSDPDDPRTAGDHFFAEAKRLLGEEEDLNSLVSIQALGLMAIREGSCGRDTESFYYCQMAIRLAVETGLHREQWMPNSEEREVRRATFWGAFTLDQAWSLSLAKLPHLSYNTSFPPKPSIIKSSESAPWIPYSDEGTPEHISANQPCNVHSVYKCFCELSGLIHSSLYTLHSPQKRFTSEDLIHHYTTYLSWYGEIPVVLRLGSNFTPSVLFVHLYYHFATLCLFFPFINLRLTRSRFDPAKIVREAASAITSLVCNYRNLYSLGLTPSMTPYLLMMSTIAHLRFASSDIGQLQESIKQLSEMKTCHGFASRALEICKFLAQQWGVEGAFGDGEDREGRVHRDWENVKPKANSTNLFVPRGVQTDGEGVLFSVFPLQGVPLLGCGEELAEDGFEVIDGGSGNTSSNQRSNQVSNHAT